MKIPETGSILLSGLNGGVRRSELSIQQTRYGSGRTSSRHCQRYYQSDTFRR